MESVIQARRRKNIPRIPRDQDEFLQLLRNNPVYNKYFLGEYYVEGQVSGFIFSNDRLKSEFESAENILLTKELYLRVIIIFSIQKVIH